MFTRYDVEVEVLYPFAHHLPKNHLHGVMLIENEKKFLHSRQIDRYGDHS